MPDEMASCGIAASRDPLGSESTDPPLHPLLTSRWSPTTFHPAAGVTTAEMESLLEAAMGTIGGKLQPWAFIVGRHGESEHDRLVATIRRKPFRDARLTA